MNTYIKFPGVLTRYLHREDGASIQYHRAYRARLLRLKVYAGCDFKYLPLSARSKQHLLRVMTFDDNIHKYVKSQIIVQPLTVSTPEFTNVYSTYYTSLETIWIANNFYICRNMHEYIKILHGLDIWRIKIRTYSQYGNVKYIPRVFSRPLISIEQIEIHDYMPKIPGKIKRVKTMKIKKCDIGESDYTTLQKIQIERLELYQIPHARIIPRLRARTLLLCNIYCNILYISKYTEKLITYEKVYTENIKIMDRGGAAPLTFCTYM